MTPSYGIFVDNEPLEIRNDTKAYFDILRRVRHMFGIKLGLSDLEQESDKLISHWAETFKKLSSAGIPQLSGYIRHLQEEFQKFEERKFEEPTKVRREVEEILKSMGEK